MPDRTNWPVPLYTRLLLNPEVLAVYRTEPRSSGAPRKMARETQARAEQLRLMERYASRAADPQALALRLARGHTLLLARQGLYRAARPHARAWWRRNPWQLRAPWIWLRGLVSRR